MDSGNELVLMLLVLGHAMPTSPKDEMKPDQAALGKFECRGVCATAAGCGTEGSMEAKRAMKAAAPAKILGNLPRVLFIAFPCLFFCFLPGFVADH